MNICNVMKRDVRFVSPDTTIKEAARLMRDRHISALPVLDNGKLVGMITDRDICYRVTANGRDAIITKVGEIMATNATTCFEDQDITEVA